MPQFYSPREGSQLAYHKTEATEQGKDLPLVIFCGGFMSDMEGSKATFLETECAKRGQAYIRFDYSGHGQSSGAFTEGTIGLWKEDALSIFDNLTDNKPVILVGSSMGGWISMMIAMERPDRVAAWVGLAPAPDFTEEHYWAEFNADQRKALLEDGVVNVPSDYGEPYPITDKLIRDGRENLIIQGDTVEINCPVHILQGKQDTAVPWEKANRIAGKLTSDDVTVTFIDDGDHSLSRPQDLVILDKVIREFSDLGQQ